MNTKLQIILAVMFFSFGAFAEVLVYKYDGSAFSKVADADVESKCGKNFIFRSEYKEQAPKYLGKEIIKASFTGKLSPSFDALLGSAKASKDKCIWVSQEEAAQLK